MITKKDIGRTFISKDGLEMRVVRLYNGYEDYIEAENINLTYVRLYHTSGAHSNIEFGTPSRGMPAFDFAKWADEKPYSDHPEGIKDILNEWESGRPYDPKKVMGAKRVLHEKGVEIAARIRGKRKPLIVFSFNSTVKLEAVDSYLKSVREQIGHAYDIIAVNGAEMSIVDTEELKVTKVL